MTVKEAREFALEHAGRRVRYTHRLGQVPTFEGTVVGFYAAPFRIGVMPRPDDYSEGVVIAADGASPLDLRYHIHVVFDARNGHYFDPEFVTLEFLDAPAKAKKDDRFPHVCQKCRGPAYVGAYAFECKAGCAR